MKNRISIVWFRNDLRIHDNKTLYEAYLASGTVLPIYVIDPTLFRGNKLGIKKTGFFRIKFILESVHDLRINLKKLGADLYVEVGNPKSIISKLAKEHKVDAVYASKEVTDEEVKVEEQVEKVLWEQGVRTEFFWQSTLYHLNDIPFPVNSLPNIYTQFRKSVEKISEVREIIPSPKELKKLDINYPEIPSLQRLGFENRSLDERSSLIFVGGESNGIKRLEDYFWENQHIKTYKETRNGLIGEGYSTKFSPWLSIGCLSPRYIFHQVESYEKDVLSNDSTYWVKFELIWRDYFRFVAKKFGNKIFQAGGIKGEINHSHYKNTEKLEKWMNGETGTPFIDANMIELNQTGFMSNRGRQNVASYFVKDLKLNWQLGAEYFESLLIDYDPCSNWGNWNYVAGIGNDPRENRYFNIMSQAKRYDPKGKYVKLWIPELSDIHNSFVHHPDLMHPKERGRFNIPARFKKPIVTSKEWQK